MTATGTKNILITVSEPAYFEGLRADLDDDGWTRWTIYSGARPGQHLAFYFTEPLYGIAARGRVLTQPTPHADPGSEWDGRLMSDVDDLQLLITPLPLAALKFCFTEWTYWSQPRTNIRAPDPHAARLSRLIEFFIRPTVTDALSSLHTVAEDYGGIREYRRRMARVRKHRRQMLEALAREHDLSADDTVCYVALNLALRSDELAAATFDCSLDALAGYLKLEPLPPRVKKISGRHPRAQTQTLRAR
ncbi:MAG: hypothetical protein ACJ74Q_15160 [Pyrinomonadaceae bacterium]